MLTAILLLTLAAPPADPPATSASVYLAAVDDRRAYEPNGANYGYVAYVTTSHLQGEARTKAEVALRFITAASSRQQIAEYCTPAEVAPGLHRVDTRLFKWSPFEWQKVAARNPYQDEPGKVPLIVPGDWLAVQLLDTTKSDAYYRLLYGRTDLKRDDFLKILKVQTQEAEHEIGIITTTSAADGPAVALQRFIRSIPTTVGARAYGTEDSAEINEDTNHLDHPNRDGKHDAEEWLVPLPKVGLTDRQTGYLLAAWINDAQGNRQEEAPPSIVTDHSGFRGQRAIRNNGSCWGCHSEGIRHPEINLFRRYIEAGVESYVSPKEAQAAIERYYLTDTAKDINRFNEDYAVAMRLVTGQDCATVAEAVRGTWELYDAPVTLDAAAAMLYITPEDLTLAIARANYKAKVSATPGKVNFSKSLIGLGRGLPVSRRQWEQLYPQASRAVFEWSQR